MHSLMFKKNYTLLILTIFIGIVIHLLPFFIHSNIPFGYDYGFYRRYLIQPLVSFPNSPVPGLGMDALIPRSFLDFLRILTIPPDIILVITAILSTAITTVTLFFLIKQHWGEKTALLASFLFTLSAIQYNAYWFMFLKNIFALPFLFLTFLLIKKNSWWAIMPGLIVMLSHHTTSVVLLATLGLYLILRRGNRKYLFLIFSACLAVFLFLHGDFYLGGGLKNLFSSVFLTKKEFLSLAFPLIVLVVFGIEEFLAMRFLSPLFAYAIITVLFPILSLPFYERIFLFLDIVLVIIASLGITKISQEIRRSYISLKYWSDRINILVVSLSLILVVAFGWIIFNLGSQINNLRPPLNETEFKEIAAISSLVPHEASILTSAIYAPWIQGWTLNRVFAPTILNDHFTKEQWLSFWKAESPSYPRAFLNQFPKPLYLFLDNFQQEKLLLVLGSCLETKSEFIFHYRC